MDKTQILNMLTITREALRKALADRARFVELAMKQREHYAEHMETAAYHEGEILSTSGEVKYWERKLAETRTH